MKLQIISLKICWAVVILQVVVGCSSTEPLPKVKVGDQVNSFVDESDKVRILYLKLEKRDVELIKRLELNEVNFGYIKENESRNAKNVSIEHAEAKGTGIWWPSSKARLEIKPSQYERISSEGFSGLFYLEGSDWLLSVETENGKVTFWHLKDFLLDESHDSLDDKR